jgi:hypothetical protein
MLGDLKRRLPYYCDDWAQGFRPKNLTTVLGAALFMFFTSFFPALIFGQLLEDDTETMIGIPEVLLATGLCGVLWAFCAGQPLVIVGVTGPVTVFVTALFDVSKSFDVPFFDLHCWTCIWAALMHWAMAVFGLCTAVDRVTRFSCETFGFFIAVIYIKNALTHLLDFGQDITQVAINGWLGFGTFWFSLSTHHARNWPCFNASFREFMAQYGTVLAIAVWTAVSFSAKFDDASPVRLAVPDDYDLTPTAPRDWLLNPWKSSLKTILLAFPAAALLTLLFFFDHNVSSRMSQEVNFNLKKGHAYHWDFFILGLTVLGCGLLGIPPANGLIPQAPMHVRSLATIVPKVLRGGAIVEEYEHVVEQRVSNLVQSLLMLLFLPLLYVPAYIPKAVLSGTFLYMGVAGLYGNTFATRLAMLVTELPRINTGHDFLQTTGGADDNGMDDSSVSTTVITNLTKVKKFTCIQALIWGGIFAVSGPWMGSASIIFPFLIAVLVPIRERLLPLLLGEEAVDVLDGVEHIEPEPTRVRQATVQFLLSSSVAPGESDSDVGRTITQRSSNPSLLSSFLESRPSESRHHVLLHSSDSDSAGPAAARPEDAASARRAYRNLHQTAPTGPRAGHL